MLSTLSSKEFIESFVQLSPSEVNHPYNLITFEEVQLFYFFQESEGDEIHPSTLIGIVDETLFRSRLIHDILII